MKFKDKMAVDQFFIENALVNYEKDGNIYYARARDQVEQNKLWQRTVLNKNQKTNEFMARLASAPEYASIVSSFFF